ncbi:MAG: double zinc ribbon domain-containing protein [Desulfuromonadaceae bacterium]
MTLWSAVKNELLGLLDLLLPPACPFCRQPLAAPTATGICPTCLDQLPNLPPARCPRCALPYVAEDGSAHLCEGCLRQPPPFETVVAVGIYEGLLRDGIHRFKFHNAVQLDRPLALLLAARLERPRCRNRPGAPALLNPWRTFAEPPLPACPSTRAFATIPQRKHVPLRRPASPNPSIPLVMSHIRYYITGHGLGHASRSCQIISRLRQRHPELKVEVVSTAHSWFLRHYLDPSPQRARPAFTPSASPTLPGIGSIRDWHSSIRATTMCCNR